MTTVLTMPSAVSIPCFIPASKATETAAVVKVEDSLGLFNDGELDFDLLADYLLEEADVTDFGAPLMDQTSSEVTPPTSISPSLDFADPLADATFPITYSQTQQQGQGTLLKEPPKQQQQQQQVPINVVPTPVQNVIHNPPPPIASAPPPLAGMSGPPSLQGIAPAPAPTSNQTMIVHHHKRQRIETTPTTNPQMQMPSTMQSTTTTTTTTMKPMSHAPTPSVVPVPAPMAITTPAPAPGQMQQIMNNRQIIDQQQRSGRQKSQAQIDRRRERNRILARRTRLRKKFFFESLQKEVMDLQKENLVLKEIVRTRVEENKARKILDTCTANQELPQVVLEHCGDPSVLAQQDFNLMASIKQSQQSFVITDPSLQDNPIVYASDDFLELTGYTREQVLGRNCRFLQGTDTDPNKVAEIRKGLQNGDDVSVTFLNYCADGTPFWNKLFIAALRDAQNNIVNYIGVSVKVAGDHESGLIQGSEVAGMNEQHNGSLITSHENTSLDFDATVMAIEGAVTAAVAAAPNVVKKIPTSGQ